jgi:hypothetical protein
MKRFRKVILNFSHNYFIWRRRRWWRWRWMWRRRVAVVVELGGEWGGRED